MIQIAKYKKNIIKKLGGEIITIDGVNFTSSLTTIYIGTTLVKIISSNDHEILIESPKMNPGIYNLIIPVGNLGNAK